jgi:GrpB-like predicted nucleotidyltransferase (UPF0157 family)
MRQQIIIVDYDPQWPILYEEERTKILAVIGDKVVAIEHIGSTAIPDLGAKPIIDIMVGVRNLAKADECIEPLQGIGYEYVPEYEVSIPERRFFRKSSPAHIHLHMVEWTSDFWERHILFRDFLRTHPETARQYHQLKTELAAKFGSDRDAYTAAKTSFIESVVTKARSKQSTLKNSSQRA